MNTGEILEGVISFLFVALIFLAVLAVTFKITLKNYNVKIIEYGRESKFGSIAF